MRLMQLAATCDFTEASSEILTNNCFYEYMASLLREKAKEKGCAAKMPIIISTLGIHNARGLFDFEDNKPHVT